MKALILGLAALSVFALAGCGESEPAPSKETQQQADRLSDIQAKSGGDWSKLDQADRDYLVKDLAHGSESSARMLLGPPKANPGGGKVK